ncbi:unnamed protein product [Polarella glacialis]|uniref:Chitin synthase n=1 Tax=Polarella glacialis TaxID=89957 RepID=A0A813KJG2_POLGL|nr:unnamed protein product [Polarella glacialis]
MLFGAHRFCTPSHSTRQFRPRISSSQFRALFRNAKINFCPQSRSGELAPASFGSFYKQRLRWCMGWDQVTLMHTKPISGMQELSFALRFGMHWMLIGRWVSLFFMLVNAAMAPLLLIDKGFFRGPLQNILRICQFNFLLMGAIILVVFFLFFCMFLLMMAPLTLLLQLALLFTSFPRLMIGNVGDWVATERASGGAGGGPLQKLVGALRFSGSETERASRRASGGPLQSLVPPFRSE